MSDWKKVLHRKNQAELEIAKTYLDRAGIESLVEPETAFGSFELLVHTKDVEASLEILEASGVVTQTKLKRKYLMIGVLFAFGLLALVIYLLVWLNNTPGPM